MNLRLNQYLPLLMLSALAATTIWLARTVNNVSTHGDGKIRHEPDIIIENFTAKQFSPTGNVQYTLTASKMIHYPDDDTAHLTKVNFQATEPGKPPMHAIADTGILSKKGDEVFLHNNVVLVREASPESSKITMSTNFLHIIPNQDIAQTNQPVMIEDGGSRINASSMIANNKNQTIIFKGVKARYEKK